MRFASAARRKSAPSPSKDQGRPGLGDLEARLASRYRISARTEPSASL